MNTSPVSWARARSIRRRLRERLRPRHRRRARRLRDARRVVQRDRLLRHARHRPAVRRARCPDGGGRRVRRPAGEYALGGYDVAGVAVRLW